jgi:hypothetical protein
MSSALNCIGFRISANLKGKKLNNFGVLNTKMSIYNEEYEFNYLKEIKCNRDINYGVEI